MKTTTFRHHVDELALRFGFLKRRSFWFKSNPETVVALDLQRSGYGRNYYLNVRVWLQGFGDRSYDPKDLARETGHIFRREPPEFADVLDLDTPLAEPQRFARLDELFSTFIGPITEALSTRDGIRRLARERPDLIHLLPAIKAELRP